MTTTRQKRKKPTAFDALKYVNDRVTKLESEQIGNEQAFKVCNEAINELTADMDKVDGRLDQFDLDLKALCKSVTAMGNDINRISAGLEAIRHHTTEKPALPAHMEAVSEQTFGHGDVFEDASYRRWRLLRVADFSEITIKGERAIWIFESIKSRFVFNSYCKVEYPTKRDLFPDDHKDWRHVPTPPSERV